MNDEHEDFEPPCGVCDGEQWFDERDGGYMPCPECNELELDEIEVKLGDPEFIATAPAEQISWLRKEWEFLKGHA